MLAGDGVLVNRVRLTHLVRRTEPGAQHEEVPMSIFGSIVNAIFGGAKAAGSAIAGASSNAGVGTD